MRGVEGALIIIAMIMIGAAAQNVAAQSCTPTSNSGSECIVTGEGRVIALEGNEIREQVLINRCDRPLIVSYRWAGDFQSRKQIPPDGSETLRCNATRCTGELTWGAVCENRAEPGKQVSLTVVGPAVPAEPEPPEEAQAATPPSASTEEADHPREAPPPPASEGARSTAAADTPAAPATATSMPPPENVSRRDETPVAPAPVERETEVAGAPIAEPTEPVPLSNLLPGAWDLDGEARFACETQTSEGTLTLRATDTPGHFTGQAAIETAIALNDGCELRYGRETTWTYRTDVTAIFGNDRVAITWHKFTPENPGGTSVYTVEDGMLMLSGEHPRGGTFEERWTRRR